MPDVIYIVAAILFAIRIIILTLGGLRERRRMNLPTESYQPTASIIVPARNEENNIARCLQSLVKSNYPADRYEIIAVNDRSEDGTGKVLLDLSETMPNLRIVTITEPRQEINLKGKPGALDAGIKASRGEIILMTDADCIVPTEWISYMTAQFKNDNVGLAAAFTTIRPNSIFETMQAVEWSLSHTMALAGVGLRQPLGCFGNNLAIRRSVYNLLGGFAGIRFSVTEDLALLQAVFATGSAVRYICHEKASVETKPCANFAEYLLQHHRWARGGLGLGWRAAVFVILSATLAVSLATAIITSNYVLIPIIIAIRAAGDATIVYPSIRLLNRNDLRLPALYSVVFLMLLEMVAPILALKPTVRWKGQKLR